MAARLALATKLVFIFFSPSRFRADITLIVPCYLKSLKASKSRVPLLRCSCVSPGVLIGESCGF